MVLTVASTALAAYAVWKGNAALLNLALIGLAYAIYRAVSALVTEETSEGQ